MQYSRRHRLVMAEFLRERRSRLSPTAQERRSHPKRRVRGLTRAELAARAGVSITWYSWLEMGRDVHATPSTLRAIARALALDRDETAYLLALGGDLPAGLPLGQTGDVNDAVLAQLVDGFRDGPAFVVNRRWDIIASNAAAREIYAYMPSTDIAENVVWRLLHDPQLRALHQDPDAMMESVVSLVRYNYADDPENAELVVLLDTLKHDTRFARAWTACSVRIFSPMFVTVKRKSGAQRFLFVALSVGRQGHESLVLHLPQW
ncbi:MAG: helix-turn-helix domain-containing protein [Candidatus Eremiobacteraeota bacterium]|nr:helix-turn-helix domain-containing protein [Candidatus Eremiobacteraeota bacterium]